MSNKGVRFREEALCEYHEGAMMDLEGVKHFDIWYQLPDMQNMKRKALATSREAQKYGFGSLLTNTYGRSCAETQKAVNTWVVNGNSRRGLERFINDEYSAKRSDIRKRTIHSVLRAQARIREEGIHDVEYGIKVMSRLSEAFSVDSRQFAHVFGLADEHAVKMDEQKDLMAMMTDKQVIEEKAVHLKARVVTPPRRSSSFGLSKRLGLGLSGSSQSGEGFRYYF